MIDRLRTVRLLGAFAARARADREALVSALVALGDFAMDAGDLLAELDLNPVIVLAEGQGCVVVDGAAVLKG
ncbi:MAG: acetate--CoA ligase family protein [Alphaproteobacteria bacterium]